MPTKLIKIKSSHDSQNNNHASFRTHLSQTFPEIRAIKSIALIGGILPNKVYSVRTGVNDVLRYNLDTAGITSLTVAQGNYTTSELMTVMAAEFGSGVTIIQQDYTKYINFATDAGTTLDLYTVESDSLSTMSTSIGLNIDIVLGNSSNSDTSNTPDLNFDMYLIKSNVLANNNLISSSTDSPAVSNNTIACIPSTVSFGFNETWLDQGNLEQTRITYDQPRNISDIDIQIHDSNDVLLDLQSEVTLIFRVYY